MRLTLEPWDPLYETSSLDMLGAPHDHSDVDLGVELPVWRAVQTLRRVTRFRRLLLLDGRRRVEARVFAEWREGKIRHAAPGLLGTFAVGVAELDLERLVGSARILKAKPHRVVILGAGQTTEAVIISPIGSESGVLTFEPDSIPDEDDRKNGLLGRLQHLMREAEAQTAAEAHDGRPDTLLIVDGPLPYSGLGGVDSAVGYVKTLHDLRLPPAEQTTLTNLLAGQRTPVFLLRAGTSHRYSWFLRTAPSESFHQSLSGVVRLESDARHGLDTAVELADWSCQALPRLASRAYRDPRAPQQLTPVSALEANLGRLMGDASIIRRRVSRYLHNEAKRESPLFPFQPGEATVERT